jgi:ketosteroid isomerase-like protein
MSQENIDVARRATETLAEGDFGAWLALHHPSCELAPHIVATEGGEPYRGHDGCRAFWEDIHDAFDDWRPQVEELRDCGAAVLVGIRFQGVGKDSGVPIDRRVWQVFKVLDGQAIWWRIYPSEAEALEAVGLAA